MVPKWQFDAICMREMRGHPNGYFYRDNENNSLELGIPYFETNPHGNFNHLIWGKSMMNQLILKGTLSSEAVMVLAASVGCKICAHHCTSCMVLSTPCKRCHLESPCPIVGNTPINSNQHILQNSQVPPALCSFVGKNFPPSDLRSRRRNRVASCQNSPQRQQFLFKPIIQKKSQWKPRYLLR